MASKPSFLFKIVLLFFAGFVVAVATSVQCVAQDNAKDQAIIPRVSAPAKQSPNSNAMIWRFIGPMTGTRGSVVLGHPTDKSIFYHGASGGLWKTPDAGKTWIPLGDGQFGTSSVGAMKISPSNPKIMYVGMGEPQMRNNVSWGDGVYKSVDSGETWTHIGLKETHHISQIRIHPADPNIVYVSVFGHAFGPNPERSVFKTQDGGKTWKKVLFKSETAGAIDLVMNPTNPDELFASIWEFVRKAWGPKPEARTVVFGNQSMEASRGPKSLAMKVCRQAAMVASESRCPQRTAIRCMH